MSDKKTRIKKDVENWKKDLRKMSKIYRDIDPDREENPKDAVIKFNEAKNLFNTFRKNYEKWVYKDLLPKVRDGEETWSAQEVRKRAWDALYGFSGLFPDQYDYKTEKHLPAPWLLTDKQKKANINRYNRYFKKAWTAIEEHLEYMSDNIEDTPMQEQHQIGKTNIVIRNWGKYENADKKVKQFFEQLRGTIKKIEKVGFKKVADHLTIHIYFDRKDLRAGDYFYKTDRLRLFPLGLDPSTLIHELGHRYYFKLLPPNARKHWEEVLKGRQLIIDKEDIENYVKEVYPLIEEEGIVYRTKESKQLVKNLKINEESKAKFLYLSDHNPSYDVTPEGVLKHHLKFNDGSKVNLEELTDYGATDPLEAFADAFMLYVNKGPNALGPWMRDYFESVARYGGAKIKSEVNSMKLILAQIKSIGNAIIR